MSDKTVLRSGKKLVEHVKKPRKNRAKSTDTALEEHRDDDVFDIWRAELAQNSSSEEELDPDIMEDDKDKAIADLTKQLAQVKAKLILEEEAKEKLHAELEDANQGERKDKRQIHIVDSESSVQLPCYVAGKMSPESFLVEVEDYFVLKGTEKRMWVHLVRQMFPRDSDVARWWRETRKDSNNNWDEFMENFLKYERSGQSTDELLTKLFSTKQRLGDAFETFAWEVNGLYMKIDSSADDSAVVDRILNSCLPEIAVVLKQHSCGSVVRLICRAREVIGDLNKIRKRENKPLFRARATDPIETTVKQDSGNYKKFNRFKSNFQSTSQDFKEKEESVEQKPGSTQDSPKPKDSSAQKNSKSRSDKQCSYCKFKGHVYEECRFRLKKEKSVNSNNAQSKPNNEEN